MTNRIDLQVRVRHTVGKGRFGIQPIQAQQLHITESSKKINLKLNSRYLTTSVRLKDDSRPFFLSDSFQSVVHYYVSVDGMRQQEGPLKIMKSITVPAARLSVKPVRNKVIWCEMATYIHRMRFFPCRRKPNKVLGSAITSNSSALAQLLFDGQSRHNSMFEARLSNCSITGSAWGFFSMR